MKIGTTSKAGLIAGVAVAAAAAWWWDGAAAASLSANQILAQLPAGSSVHSLVRLDMDGREPAETAVVARVPAYPGSRDIMYVSIVFRYDRLRRGFVQIYNSPTPGAVPFSADAARLLPGRDAAIISGLHDDGTRSYRVIGIAQGHGVVLREHRFAGTLAFAEPLLVEQGTGGSTAIRWTGETWMEERAPETAAVALPGVTWRYAVRNGEVVARTDVQRLRPRQPLRILPVGGGATTVVVPDSRLDVVEAGFRQRQPGTYRIRIVTGLTSLDQAYTLTVIVEP
ncbi:MAG: hypothetical protein ACRDF6_07430 [bacterium]